MAPELTGSMLEVLLSFGFRFCQCCGDTEARAHFLVSLCSVLLPGSICLLSFSQVRGVPPQKATLVHGNKQLKTRGKIPSVCLQPRTVSGESLLNMPFQKSFRFSDPFSYTRIRKKR